MDTSRPFEPTRFGFFTIAVATRKERFERSQAVVF